MLMLLKQMRATEMANEVPDVVRSLEAVRLLRQAPESAPR
jgi:hypothetical protein